MGHVEAIAAIAIDKNIAADRTSVKRLAAGVAQLNGGIHQVIFTTHVAVIQR
jgi:hypothetical protein